MRALGEELSRSRVDNDGLKQVPHCPAPHPLPLIFCPFEALRFALRACFPRPDAASAALHMTPTPSRTTHPPHHRSQMVAQKEAEFAAVAAGLDKLHAAIAAEKGESEKKIGELTELAAALDGQNNALGEEAAGLRARVAADAEALQHSAGECERLRQRLAALEADKAQWEGVMKEALQVPSPPADAPVHAPFRHLTPPLSHPQTRTRTRWPSVRWTTSSSASKGSARSTTPPRPRSATPPPATPRSCRRRGRRSSSCAPSSRPRCARALFTSHPSASYL